MQREGAATRGPRQSAAGGEKVAEGREKFKEEVWRHCLVSAARDAAADEALRLAPARVRGGGATHRWRRRSGSRTG